MVYPIDDVAGALYLSKRESCACCIDQMDCLIQLQLCVISVDWLQRYRMPMLPVVTY